MKRVVGFCVGVEIRSQIMETEDDGIVIIEYIEAKKPEVDKKEGEKKEGVQPVKKFMCVQCVGRGGGEGRRGG